MKVFFEILCEGALNSPNILLLKFISNLNLIQFFDFIDSNTTKLFELN